MAQGFISKHILQDIADFIRVRRGLENKVKPVDMRAELDKIPTYEEGQENFYNAFWDSLQNYGERVDYRNTFFWWTKENFKPKYNFAPTDTRQMFSYFGTSGDAVSLIDMLNESGVTLDTTNTRNHKSMFLGGKLTEIPNIDTRKSIDIDGLFSVCAYLKKAEITVAENTVPNYNSVFNGCSSLETLIIHGKVDKSLDLSACTKLSKESIDNVFDALSTTSSGQTVKFSQTAANVYSAEQWETFKTAHSNWNFEFI